MERTSRRDARARVVGVLAEAGAVSRADLARRAALAPSTVSAVVSDLQAACLQVNGEIDELRRRIDEREDRLERLDEESDDARAERDEAAEAVALAESALRASLDQLQRVEP